MVEGKLARPTIIRFSRIAFYVVWGVRGVRWVLKIFFEGRLRGFCMLFRVVFLFLVSVSFSVMGARECWLA